MGLLKFITGLNLNLKFEGSFPANILIRNKCILTILAYHLIVLRIALSIFGVALFGLTLTLANPIQLVLAEIPFNVITIREPGIVNIHGTIFIDESNGSNIVVREPQGNEIIVPGLSAST